MYYAAGRGEITLGIEVPKIRDTPLAREFMIEDEENPVHIHMYGDYCETDIVHALDSITPYTNKGRVEFYGGESGDEHWAFVFCSTSRKWIWVQGVTFYTAWDIISENDAESLKCILEKSEDKETAGILLSQLFPEI